MNDPTTRAAMHEALDTMLRDWTPERPMVLALFGCEVRTDESGRRHPVMTDDTIILHLLGPRAPMFNRLFDVASRMQAEGHQRVEGEQTSAFENAPPDN